MKRIFRLIMLLGAFVVGGCAGEKKEFLALDFKEGTALRYKFVSSRDITITLENEKDPGKGSVDKSSEAFEMVMEYLPTNVDEYGVAAIQATCRSAKVARSRSFGKDAAEEFTGKKFTFKVGPNGKIEDRSDLRRLLYEVGEEAFDAKKGEGRVKAPDMIADFVASQWFLWDSLSSIPRASEGVDVGDVWNSKLSVPTPMVIKKVRTVQYKVDKISKTGGGKAAVIVSTYSPGEGLSAGWPLPYEGSFQMRGPFGFYRNYQLTGLSGSGEEVFNIDTGSIERSKGQYELDMTASVMGLPVRPKINIKQTLTMELLKD